MVILVQGLLFQMWNATFATFFQEQFPMRMRVTGFAVSQNVGLMIASLFPTLFTAIAPPGRPTCRWSSVAITFGIALVAAVASLHDPGDQGQDAGGPRATDRARSRPFGRRPAGGSAAVTTAPAHP